MSFNCFHSIDIFCQIFVVLVGSAVSVKNKILHRNINITNRCICVCFDRHITEIIVISKMTVLIKTYSKGFFVSFSTNFPTKTISFFPINLKMKLALKSLTPLFSKRSLDHCTQFQYIKFLFTISFQEQQIEIMITYSCG